jgi:hypothetical protein
MPYVQGYGGQYFLVVCVQNWWQGQPMTNMTVKARGYGNNQTFEAVTNNQGWANFGNLTQDYYEVSLPGTGISQGVYHKSSDTVRMEYTFWAWIVGGWNTFVAIRLWVIPLWLILLIAGIALAVYVLSKRSA